MSASSPRASRHDGFRRVSHRARSATRGGAATAPRWAAFALVFLAAACGDETPTALGPGLFPVAARTVEIRLTYDEFVERAQVLGGYGHPDDVPHAVVATQFGEEQLESRTLIRFAPFPTVKNVQDSTGTTRPDSALTFIGGRAVVRFDTTLVPASGPVTLRGSWITEEWHAPSVTFENTVDTIGGTVPWTVPGGGDARLLGTGVWDPAESDSAFFPVDSMALVSWDDRDNGARGILIEMETPGERVRIRSAALVLDAIPSIRPDTVVDAATFAQDLTFIYSPDNAAPEGMLLVGGAPAWRTVFEMGLPGAVDEPPEVCALVGCPFELTSDGVIFASILLNAVPTATAFTPVDSLQVDARPVYSPERLPKAPLGEPIQQPAQIVGPEAFQNGAGSTIAVPVTAFVKDYLRGETRLGLPAPTTLALLAGLEPQGIEFMRFLGAGSADPPVLRILVTIADGVNLP